MKFHLLVFCTLLIFFSCKKKTSDPEPAETPSVPETPRVYENYSAHKVGNYWIYNVFYIFENGLESLSRKDSTVIVKDTLVRGRTFYKFLTYAGHNFIHQRNAEYYADSLHYIITFDKIVFSSEDTTTLFQDYYLIDAFSKIDTAAKITQKMTQMEKMVTLPAGTFKTCNSVVRYDIWPNFVAVGGKNPKYSYKRYAKQIGLVQEELEPYFAYDSKSERRLIRYKVN